MHSIHGLIQYHIIVHCHTHSHTHLCTAAVAYPNAYFGQGTGLVVLDQLGCSGSETRLSDCSHRGFNTTAPSCGHDDDAGVRCNQGKKGKTEVNLVVVIPLTPTHPNSCCKQVI